MEKQRTVLLRNPRWRGIMDTGAVPEADRRCQWRLFRLHLSEGDLYVVALTTMRCITATMKPRQLLVAVLKPPRRLLVTVLNPTVVERL